MKSQKRSGFIFFLFTFIISGKAESSELSFDPSALSINGEYPTNVDLSVFERGGQLPGKYHAKIYINNAFVDERDVDFKLLNNNLVPVLSKFDYIKMGVSPDVTEKLKKLDNNYFIDDIGVIIPGATSSYNMNKQQLNISVPQAYIKFSPDDYVPPSLWDQGINAAYTSYDVSYSHKRGKGSVSSGNNSNDVFLNLDNGINIAGWRLRNNSTFTSSNNNENEWNSLLTYLQHDISGLGSQFVIGQTYTFGDVFDAFGYTGMRLYTDDNMLPYSEQGFSPVVQGIAQSQATITIKQNGYIVKQVSVPAGPFSINNINTLSSGELQVTVRESNGSERTFVQPWTTIPGMQRQGRFRYALDAGKYRSQSKYSIKSDFVQAQGQYGLNSLFTAQSGIQLAKNYQSLQVGATQSLGMLGALSFDTTWAWADLIRKDENNKKQGSSYRMQYAKSFDKTNTDISIAGYRFSTQGYYDFSEFNEYDPEDVYSSANKKSRIQLFINQSMGDYGVLSLNMYRQDYWRTNKYQNTYSLGYSFSLWKSSVNINYSDSTYDDSKSNKQLALTVSVPFSILSNPAWATYSMLKGSDNKMSNSLSLMGTLDDDRRWNYNVRESYSNKENNNAFSLSSTYKNNAGEIGGSYSSDKYNDQYNLVSHGSVMLHRYGITLGNAIYNSAVLVRAPGASNTKILGNNSLSTDRRGYALVTNVSSYHRNRIALDTSTLPDNVDADTEIKNVVPTNGAIVLADFKTFLGYQALVTILHNGKPLPFGTVVSLANNTVTGIVDEQGGVYLHGLPASGKLSAKWGRDEDSCSTSYSLPDDNTGDIKKVTLACH